MRRVYIPTRSWTNNSIPKLSTVIRVVAGGGSVFADVIQIALKIVLGIVDRYEIGARKRLLLLRRRILLMRRKDLGVAVHVAATASRNFEYVHVQSQFLVPSQQSVIVVDLYAGRPVVFGDERAGRMWISVTRHDECY